MRKAGWAVLAVLWAGSAVGVVADAEETPAGPSASLPGWLAGAWTREARGAVSEELWHAPRGGMMLASTRTASENQVYEFEFLRIVQREGTLVFIAQPNGDPPTEFALTAQGADSVRFENPAHDFPQVIVYRSTGAGRMEAVVSGRDPKGPRRVVFEFSRTPPAEAR